MITHSKRGAYKVISAEHEKLDEFTFSDLYIDTADKTFPEFHKMVAGIFRNFHHHKEGMFLSRGNHSARSIKYHKEMTWLHR